MYFTATGNSLYAARELDSEAFSIAQEIHGDMQYKADSIGIVCPIFGHEMPQPVKDFINKAMFDTDYLYLILTYTPKLICINTVYSSTRTWHCTNAKKCAIL